MKSLNHYKIKIAYPFFFILFFIVFNTQSFAQFQIRHYAPSSIYEWPCSLDAMEKGYVIAGNVLRA